MTLSEALSTGAMVTVTGISIVFIVLIILMLVMMAMKTIFGERPKRESKAKVSKSQKEKNATSEEDPNLMVVLATAAAVAAEDTKLVAVLTAAVAASMGTSANKVNIRSYRRIENNTPVWNKAGLRDVIDSRF